MRLAGSSISRESHMLDLDGESFAAASSRSRSDDRRADAVVLQRRVLVELAGGGRHEQMVDAGHLHDLDRRRFFRCAASSSRRSALSRRHLGVELAWTISTGCLTSCMTLAGIEREEALEPRRVGLAPDSCRESIFPALPVRTAC